MVASGQMAEAVDRLREATTFRVNEGGDIFTVGYTGDTPDDLSLATARRVGEAVVSN